MTAVLKNIGGIDFTNLTTTLICADTNITILDNSGYFGYLAVDSIKENLNDSYEISASVSTPQGYSAEFMLIAVDGSFADTFMFDIVIGGIDYLIWTPDLTPMSGQLINYMLTGLGYSGVYTTMLPLSDLQTYKAIFVCVGIYPSNYVIDTLGPEASALVDYVNSGGCLYIEGGDVWYYDPIIGGYNFCPLFGIDATSDGAGNVGPVVGQNGSFTQGMFFYYAGENYSIDHIDPTGSSAVLIFLDDDNGYGCGVANSPVTHKTVGLSFELGVLVDLGGVSMRSVLLDSIMHFFGIFQTGVGETNQSAAQTMWLQVQPNPFTQTTEIRYSILDTRYKEQELRNSNFEMRNGALKIYDASGRLVKDFLLPTTYYLLPTAVSWDGTDQAGRQLANGVYFLKLTAGEQIATAKISLIR